MLYKSLKKPQIAFIQIYHLIVKYLWIPLI